MPIYLQKIETKKDRDGNEVQVYVNRLPERCLGFQPGDIINLGGDYVYSNGDFEFEGRSKIELDILVAQNAQEAMDLAFFGKDYTEPQSDNTTRKGNPNDFWVKTPNVKLQFDEVKGRSRLDTLKGYYESLKNSIDCKWRIPDDGTGAKNAPNYKDPAVKVEIDRNYDLAEKFIEDYEKLLGVNIATLNKTQLEETKSKLEKWKTTRFYLSGGVWVRVINNFLTEMKGALSRLDGDDDNDVPAWKTELAGLKNRASELAQKIYQNCQPDQDGFTEAVFTELKKLVKLLEEAHGTKTANTKTELEKFISDSASDSNQKKALEMAQKVKNQDSDNGDCVATAREKLKTPSEKQLEKARQKLKSLLAGLKTGGGKDAYSEVVSSIENSETDLNKAIEIWQKLSEADTATNDDEGKLLDALNNLKNEAGNKTAWEAISKYKRDGQNQNYPDEILKKLNDWAEQRKKDYSEVKNAKTKTEFQVAKQEFIKKHEYQNNKQDYDEIYFPLAEKAAEIREQGTQANSEEKELAELLVLVVSDYNDWKTQLTDLEGKLDKLRVYTKEGERHNTIEKFSDVQQAAFEKLVNKIAAKLQEWRAEKAKSESGDNSPVSENPPWYKKPAGIIGIVIVVVLLLAGVIYYLVKQSASEKEKKTDG